MFTVQTLTGFFVTNTDVFYNSFLHLIKPFADFPVEELYTDLQVQS